MNDTDELILDHAHQLFHNELGLCGCGSPEAAYDLVRDMLTVIAKGSREAVPLIAERIGDPGARQLILSMLEEAGLLEHGLVSDGAWLTDKGRWYASALSMIRDWEAVHEGGFPHGGAECTSACWRVPVSR